MKLNLLLTFFLLTLFGVGYYSEEILKTQWMKSDLKAISLIDPNLEIIEIETPTVTLLKNDDWHIKSLTYKASESRVNELIKVIKGFQKLKQLNSKNISEFFSNTKIDLTIKTKNDRFELSIGDVSLASGYFYVKMHDKIYLAEDASYSPETYTTDEELRLKKYIKLKKLLLEKNQFFIEKNPLFDIDLTQMKSMHVDSRRNRWYKLNFEKNSITPKPYKGLDVLNLQKNAIEYLTNLKTKTLHSSGQFILSDLSGEINIELASTKLKLKLYSSLNGRYGKFLKISDNLSVFELEENSDLVFHNDYQVYWNKKFFQNINFSTTKKLNFKLKKRNSDFVDFVVPNVQDFSIKAKSKNIDINTNMTNFLFNLVLNLADFAQPYLVSQVKWEDAKKVEGDFIELKLLKKHLKVLLAKSEVIVYEKEQGLAYYFKFNTEQFPPEILQSIFTVKKN